MIFVQDRSSQQWALLGDPQGSRGRGGALHIGHRHADDRCLWSEHPGGVHRRQVWALSDESDGGWALSNKSDEGWTLSDESDGSDGAPLSGLRPPLFTMS